MSAGVNSGVYIRCTDWLAGPGNGMEVQIVDEDDERGRGLPAKARTGAIWNVAGPAKRATRGFGQWNTLEVTCLGDLTRVAVNGTTTPEVDASCRTGLGDLPWAGCVGLLPVTGGLRPVAARRGPTVAGHVLGDGGGVGHHVAIFAIGELPILRTYFREPPRLRVGDVGESMGIDRSVVAGGPPGRRATPSSSARPGQARPVLG